MIPRRLDVFRHKAKRFAWINHWLVSRKCGQIFETKIVAHWCLHKGMSGYYTNVMQEIRKKTGVRISAHYANTSGIPKALAGSQLYPSNVLILSDLLDYQIPREIEFRGTVTLRDPRDLLVSGYFYHLNTTEQWANFKDFDWQKVFKQDVFTRVFGEVRLSWIGRSYSDVLRSLSLEDGLMLELARMEPVIRSLNVFPFDDVRILRMNYESIIQNEATAFRTMFNHYGLDERFIDLAVNAADELSASKTYGKNPHIRSLNGTSWHNVLRPSHLELLMLLFSTECRLAGYDLST